MTDALLLLGVIISQYFPFEVDELSASVKQSEDLGHVGVQLYVDLIDA